MRMTSGSTAIARAMQRRCCWPPDRANASWLSLSFTSSHSAALRRTASTFSSLGLMPLTFIPNVRLSRIDFGNGFGFWNTIPIRRRRSTASTSEALRSSPWNWSVPRTLVPGMRSFMRLRQRRNVDLPQPDGPMSAVISFRRMSSVTPWSACVLP